MTADLTRVEALAPDQASLNAASKLLAAKYWPSVGQDAAAGLVWGECQGSGSAPYRVVAALTGEIRYRCSCPSRKFPCKHTLGLLWRYAERPGEFPATAPPEWVTEWSQRGRPKSAARSAAAEPAEAKPTGAPSIAAARETPTAPVIDETRAARAATQRDRTRAAREAATLRALDELDQWIGDQIDRGLAHFPAVAREQCRTVARRLADGKAPGLANLVDRLPHDVFQAPDRERDDVLIIRLGALHLAAEGYRRQERLPGGLREDLRRLVGWSVKREDLLADPAALRITARWQVLGVRVEAEPDGLRRVETWLGRAGAVEPRFALLIDFYPAGTVPTSATPEPGDCFESTAVYYPSAVPLRVVLDGRVPAAAEPLPAGEPLESALVRWEECLARQPFLGRLPVAIAGTVVAETADGGFALLDRNDERGVSLDPRQSDEMLALVGLEPIEIAGIWNGRTMELLAATTPLGRWHG